jgi:hypothetical protein
MNFRRLLPETSLAAPSVPGFLRDNRYMADRLVMSRLIRQQDAGRDFDVEFWQKLGDEKIFAAA